MLVLERCVTWVSNMTVSNSKLMVNRVIGGVPLEGTATCWRSGTWCHNSWCWAIPLLRAWMPSKLLAAMLNLCPWGQEESSFFTFFLSRQPMQMRLLLLEEVHTGRRAPAEKAEMLWAHNNHHTHIVISAVVWRQLQWRWGSGLGLSKK
jgi:hypothetical protein